MGFILHVDLNTEKSRTETLPDDAAELFLGGKGLGALLLYKVARPKADPLSPEYPLIFFTGPLTGTLAPTGNRFAVVTKSPLTGAFLDSHCGGPFGIALKHSGHDAIVLTGKAEAPSAVIIRNGQVEIAPANDVWGRSTQESEVMLKRRFGSENEVACIGPAGERLAPIACIYNSSRVAGRGGAGAVMGSKNVKAVAASGDSCIEVDDVEAFKKAAWSAHRLVRMNETTVRQLPKYGTNNILEVVNVMGGLPVRNFQRGVLDEPEEVFGERWRKEIWTRDRACTNCPIACSKTAAVKSGDYAGATCEGPDYETTWALGPNCGVTDKGAIVKANELCDLYGVDTISTGGAIGFAMECFERGLLTPEDLDGIKATFGNARAMVQLSEKIARGDGVGRTLQNGVRRSARAFAGAKGTGDFEDYAIEVKGMELPAYEPRGAQGMGLAYATSDRGACHLRAYTVGQELLGYWGGVDPQAIEGKAQLVIDKQNEKAVVDSAGLCFFSFFAISLKEIRRMVVAATGLRYESSRDLEQLGERVYNLTRMFNVREGLSRDDDRLPRRLLEVPLAEGPAKGRVVKLGDMLPEYYSLRGWNADGVPTEQKLQHLGLSQLLKT